MYKFTNVSIPQEQRAKINQEIIEDIKKDLEDRTIVIEEIEETDDMEF